MTKRKKFSLDELNFILPALNAAEQRNYIGGGSGTYHNPYDYQEWMNLAVHGNWHGGWVFEDNTHMNKVFIGQNDNITWDAENGFTLYGPELSEIYVYGSYNGAIYADYSGILSDLNYIYNHDGYYNSPYYFSYNPKGYGNDFTQYWETVGGSCTIYSAGTFFTSVWNTFMSCPAEVVRASEAIGKMSLVAGNVAAIACVVDGDVTEADKLNVLSAAVGDVGAALITWVPLPQAKIIGLGLEGVSVLIAFYAMTK